MYRAYVNGKETELKELRVSAYPFNRLWPGRQRSLDQTETAYMLRIYGEGRAEIRIESASGDGENGLTARVRPLSKNVPVDCAGGACSFALESHGMYVVEFGGSIHHAVHLFYDAPRDFSEYGAPTYSFESGEHDVGKLMLRDGESVYIGKDAVLRGVVGGIDARGIKIFGYGAIDSSSVERTEKNGDLGFDGEASFSPEKLHTMGSVRFYRCSDIVVDGIAVTDSPSYAMSFFDGDGITVRGVKVVGHWRYNCDGIDFINCCNIRVSDCFVRSFDDSICLKGLTAFSERSVKNAVIERCALWSDWGKVTDIGLATAAPEICGVTYRDCDVLHGVHTCLAISNGQWADIHDVVYDNVRIELDGGSSVPRMQSSDEESYTETDERSYPVLVSITDARRNWQGNASYDDGRAKIRNIAFRNISVTSDAAAAPEIRIEKCTELSSINNITFENVRHNGIPMETPDEYER